MAAQVISVVAEGDVLRTVIRLDSMPSEPIAPASLWSLAAGDEPHELHQIIDRSGLQVTFETYGASGTLPLAGATYAFQPWWSAQQLALARDAGRAWRRRAFTPSDAVAFTRQGGTFLRRTDAEEMATDDGVLFPDGWDHEHCALCWATISPWESDEHVGYTDGRRWLCAACYERFIASGLGARLG